MKNLLIGFVALLAMPLLAATEFKEGEHYEVVSEQGTTKPEVKEFFSYYCPACNAIDPLIPSVIKALPEGVTFKKYHVDFMGGATEEIQKGLTTAMVLAKTQGKGEEVNKALFAHIHRDRKAFASMADIRSIVVAAGVDDEAYDKNLNNFMVKTQVNLMQKEQAKMSSARILTSVPTFIVNGRYKLLHAKLDPARQEQELKDLINYLLKK